MRILQVHNQYQKIGGEDSVVEEERAILIANGHEVVQYIRNNSELANYSKLDMIKLIPNLRSSKQSKKELTQIIDEFRPDICHVHNVFSLVSPVVYELCKNYDIPVVQTLHNYRLLCVNSLLFREGKICEECIGKSSFHALKYKCYRDSYLQTALIADTLEYHRKKSTWTERVHAYICLSEFARKKFISAGLPEEKMVVKPNFMTPLQAETNYGDFFLFAGRLEKSKGIFDLIEMAKNLPNCQFLVVGEADDDFSLLDIKNIDFLGPKSRKDLIKLMSDCRAVIFPSVWYEGMPMVIIEAFSMKKAVIARDIGAMSSMINHGINGLKYANLAESLDCVLELHENKDLAIELGANAYLEYLDKYTPENGYSRLIEIYKGLLNGA